MFPAEVIHSTLFCDAAKSSLNSVNFFGIIQRLFTLFSASTYRWSVLTSHAEIFTLKTLSDTRWEAKIESLKAIRYQISSVHHALITLNENEKKNPDVAHEAITLAEQLGDFGFLVSLIAWYDVLFQVNVVSKSLQAKKWTLHNVPKCWRTALNF